MITGPIFHSLYKGFPGPSQYSVTDLCCYLDGLGCHEFDVCHAVVVPDCAMPTEQRLQYNCRVRRLENFVIRREKGFYVMFPTACDPGSDSVRMACNHDEMARRDWRITDYLTATDIPHSLGN